MDDGSVHVDQDGGCISIEQGVAVTAVGGVRCDGAKGVVGFKD